MIWFTVFLAFFIISLIVFADAGKLQFLLRIMNSVPYGDKAVHFFLIGLLSFFVNKTAVRFFPGQNPRRVFAVVTFLLLVFFTFEEASQGLIRGRDASLGDLAANYAGITIFSLLAYLTHKKVEDASLERSGK